MNTSIPLSLLLLRHISEIRLRLTPLPAAPAESAQARSRSRACTSGGDLKTPSGVGDSVRKLSESTDSGRAAGQPALLCERGRAGTARSKRFAARLLRRPPQKLGDADKLVLAFFPFLCYNRQNGGKNGKYDLSKARAVGARRKQTMKKCVAVLLAVGMAAALCACGRDAGSPSAPAESSQTISEEVSEEVREETSSPAADTNARVPCLRTP